MRRIRSICTTLGGLVLAVNCWAANAPAAQSPAPQVTAPQIHAGPVYTRGDAAGVFPRYPDLQVQVEVPPGTDQQLLQPSAFSLKADGKAHELTVKGKNEGEGSPSAAR